ncbi:MAG: alpha/beta hydrolase [Lachnospiraceae bacterium]|nr:alpha/beta hydrolase [Lachnospiraceae bacterium]
MPIENRTLCELLSDPRISLIAPDAITNMDLSKTDMWDKTLLQLREEHFGGGMTAGFERLYKAAESGNWYYPLYSEEECSADPEKKGVNLVFLPSEDEKAGGRPYVLLVPGGGFVNVWNLTEGWPIAAQYNELGYHVFILTYRVDLDRQLLDKEMEDFARAIRFITAHEKQFGVQGSRYITCGFSAGGYLVCLWNVPEKGYASFSLPKPQAVFPVYPLTSVKLLMADGLFDAEEAAAFYGCSIKEAANSPYEIPEHVEGFPPCALFLAAGDTLVKPEHSKLLAKALEESGIPCRLEIGDSGGHGFADGSGMCMEGWTKRAIRWYEEAGKR